MIKNIFLIFLISFFSFLAYSSIWAVMVVGDIEFEKILFHLLVPLKKAPMDWAVCIWVPFAETILQALLLYIYTTRSKRHPKKRLFRYMLFCACSSYLTVGI